MMLMEDFFLPTALMALAWDLSIQVSVNIYSGEDWYSIDVNTAVVSFVLGGFLPGAPAWHTPITKAGKALKAQQKTVVEGVKFAKRASNNIRKWRMKSRHIKAKAKESKYWKQAIQTGVLAAGVNLLEDLANQLMDVGKEAFAGECPPRINETITLGFQVSGTISMRLSDLKPKIPEISPNPFSLAPHIGVDPFAPSPPSNVSLKSLLP